MYNRILVPLDGSDLAESALPYASQIARAFNATIFLISSVRVSIDPEVSEKMTEELRQEAHEYLRRTADSLPTELNRDYAVKIGHPAEIIVDESGARDNTLIVMSTRGHSGLKRLMLGSVANKVVQASEAPILLIPAKAKNPHGGPVTLKRTIVALDGSELAERILPGVVDFCNAMDMELILVRAYNPVFPGSSIRKREITEIVHDAAENYIKDKAAELSRLTDKDIRYHVLQGIPEEQIVDFAMATPDSITAMCTHGRHGPGRWLLGSVTDAVIRSLQEPILVIRGSQTGN